RNGRRSSLPALLIAPSISSLNQMNVFVLEPDTDDVAFAECEVIGANAPRFDSNTIQIEVYGGVTADVHNVLDLAGDGARRGPFVQQHVLGPYDGHCVASCRSVAYGEVAASELHAAFVFYAFQKVGITDEISDKTGGRTFVDFVPRSQLLDLTLVHDHDSVGHGHGFFLI